MLTHIYADIHLHNHTRSHTYTQTHTHTPLSVLIVEFGEQCNRNNGSEDTQTGQNTDQQNIWFNQWWLWMN